LPTLCKRAGADANLTAEAPGDDPTTHVPPRYVPPAAPLDDLIAEYLAQLTTEAQDVYRRLYVGLGGDAVEQRGRSALDDGLRRPGAPRGATPAGHTLADLLSAMPGEHADAGDGKPTPVPDVATRLVDLTGMRMAPGGRPATRRAVLLGQPGSGKTWTLNRVFIEHADTWRSADAAERDALPVPVLVSLREFAGVRDGKPLAFRAFVQESMGQLGTRLDDLIASGRLLLLCDALNEMPRSVSGDRSGGEEAAADDAMRSDARADEGARDLVADVRSLLSRVPSFVVSCRKDDYRADLQGLGDIEQVTLAPLDPPRMWTIIERRCGMDTARAQAIWHQMDGSDDLLAYWDACVAAQVPDAFWNRDAQPPEGVEQWDDKRYTAWKRMFGGQRALIPLCREPFMLGIVCDIAATGGDLPANRVQLFERFIGASLVREQSLAKRRGEPWSGDSPDDLHGVLVALAKALQTAQRTVVDPNNLAARPSTDTVDDPNLIDVRQSPDRKRWCIDTATAAGILVRTGEGLSFAHQLLQEFFAAHEMLAAKNADQSAAAFFSDGEGWWDPGPWRVTTVILGELLGGRAAGPNDVARWLAPVSPEVALDVIAKNGEGLRIAADANGPSDVEDATRTALIAGARARLDEPHPHGRAAAYRVLGRLNADDRPGIGLNAAGLPDIVWCAVPGGAVVIEDGVGEKSVAPFKIAQFPVTYAQYKAFRDTPGGYADERWWTMAPKLADRQAEPGEQRWPIGNHPAERVSWYDAMAFCRWLTARMRAELPDALPPGTEIRLPTEAEWQQAATGGKKANRYPWGKDLADGMANINETWLGEDGTYYVGQTTAVGMYPRGVVRGLGDPPIHDMSGNVWEWTLSERSDGGNGKLTQARRRVVRGGSWYRYHGSARARSRFDSDPDYRYNDLGFRVVLAAPVS
ncbi:MAG: SUMF1/EgtB/PvdO family nonheme iron enzyme, partial [Ardenticatenales bacterium]